VSVDLGQRSYDILVGTGLLEQAGRHMARVLRQPRTIIVTDENVARHHLTTLEASLDASGIAHDAIILPPGEGSKSFRTLETLLDRLLDAKVERDDMITAFGGGVIGDLTGFAASILRRGVDFIQIPTTLLSQVDSSVGGKTGINCRHGKNLIGSFHQPRLVLADTGALATLPARELRAGYAEVVKYGLINDAPFFDWLEGSGAAVLALEQAAITRAVITSCRAKAAIVSADETEAGQRALLNLGHTFGHALEAETGYSARLLHGEAVSIGMTLAFDLAAHMGLCPKGDADRVRRHLDAMGLPTRADDVDARLTPDILIAHMAQDKKVKAGRVTFVLPCAIGNAILTRDVGEDALRDVLRAFIEG
jgi:3-dehydroquinate synthase